MRKSSRPVETNLCGSYFLNSLCSAVFSSDTYFYYIHGYGYLSLIVTVSLLNTLTHHSHIFLVIASYLSSGLEPRRLIHSSHYCKFVKQDILTELWFYQKVRV